ncbi:MAG: heavy metal translocating P-type ATPase metal-binding domain-containing protein [Verrucomicrobiota bacterium]
MSTLQISPARPSHEDETARECAHCGASFHPRDKDDLFCCHGCHHVHDAIKDRGLGQFYDFREKNAHLPQKEKPFQAGDETWLHDTIQEAIDRSGNDDRPVKLTCAITGVSCLGCLWLIESLFTERDGAHRVEVSQDTATATFQWWPEKLDLAEFAKELAGFGYRLVPRDESGEKPESRSLAFRLGLCGAFALNTMAFILPRYLGMPPDFEFAALIELVALVSATLSVLVGGSYFFERAWKSWRRGHLHMDTPISLGILAAYAGSVYGWATGHANLMYFDFVSVFVFLMLGGRWVQTVALEKARRRTSREAPISPTLEKADGTTVPLDRLAPGDTILLKPGQILPVAAQLLDATGQFSLAWISGEANPHTFAQGTRLPSGAENLARSSVRLRVAESWSGSVARELMAAPENVDESDTSGWRRVLPVYLAVVIGIAVLGAAAWMVAGAGMAKGLQVMVSVFVVSCPCALGVALPFLDRQLGNLAQGLGVFVRRRRFWSRLRRVKRLIFDKTGTLTMDHPRPADPSILEKLSEDEWCALYQLTAGSLHPVSRTLFAEAVKHFSGQAPENQDGTVAEEVAGKGSLWKGDKHEWSLGKPGWRAEEGDDGFSHHALSCELRRDGKLVQRFEFKEQIRPQTVEALARLPRHLDPPVILSGDVPRKVHAMAERLGFRTDHAIGNLSPDEKASALKRFDGETALFIGDGANDSLAGQAALLCGAPFADRATLDSRADFLFTSDGLGFLPRLFELGEMRTRRVMSIFAFAAAYNVATIGVSLAGWMNPLLAAVLMPVSSVLSLLLARTEFSAKPKAAPEPKIDTGKSCCDCQNSTSPV